MSLEIEDPRGGGLRDCWHHECIIERTTGEFFHDLYDSDNYRRGNARGADYEPLSDRGRCTRISSSLGLFRGMRLSA